MIPAGLKLHLRDVAISGFSLPENEVLKKDIIIPTTIKYGLVEFDLRLGTNYIFLLTGFMWVLNFCVAVVQNLLRHLSFLWEMKKDLIFIKNQRQSPGNAEANTLSMFE